MKAHIPNTLIILAAATLSSCVAPSNLSYQPRMSDAELADSQARIEQVENRAFQQRHRERMSNAEATELATRHNPTHVTENRTSFWFW